MLIVVKPTLPDPQSDSFDSVPKLEENHNYGLNRVVTPTAWYPFNIPRYPPGNGNRSRVLAGLTPQNGGKSV